MAAEHVEQLLEELLAGLDIDQFLLSSRTEFSATVDHYDGGTFSISSVSLSFHLNSFPKSESNCSAAAFSLTPFLSVSLHPCFIFLAVVPHKHRIGPLSVQIILEEYYIFFF